MAALTSPYIVCTETALPPRLRLSVPVKYLLSILFVTLFLAVPALLKAQAAEEDYEEISVFLAVQGIGGYEITALYKNDQSHKQPRHPRDEQPQQRQRPVNAQERFSSFARRDTQRHVAPHHPCRGVVEPRIAVAVHHPPRLQNRLEAVDQDQEDQNQTSQRFKNPHGFIPVEPMLLRAVGARQ